MKITPASRSLVMVYWLVLSGYAYGLGLGLRLVTPFLDALIFMLLVVGSIIMVPIFMLLGVVLYAFPDASPTIWRDIRVLLQDGTNFVSFAIGPFSNVPAFK